jgi:hypothetical protein
MIGGMSGAGDWAEPEAVVKADKKAGKPDLNDWMAEGMLA